jgi:hypothetical protein
MYYCHIYNKLGEDAEDRQSVIAEAIILEHVPRVSECLRIKVNGKKIEGSILNVIHTIDPELDENEEETGEWTHSITLILDTLENDGTYKLSNNKEPDRS